jgi:hypothetical protein
MTKYALVNSSGFGQTGNISPSFRKLQMTTDPRSGMRSIRPARETFAAVALTGLTLGTVLRCVDGQTGGVAGAILTLIAVAVVSRYRVSWDEEGICCRTPFSWRYRRWAECSAYSLEPEQRDQSTMAGSSRNAGFGPRWLEPCRMRLHWRGWGMAINLKPYSWQDIRHLTDRVSHEIPLRERAAVTVS